MHYVSLCSALCSQNSIQIDKGNFGASLVNDPRENNSTQSLEMESDRDMGNSCNANLSTYQNKITQTCELNNNRKRRQDRAAYMRQYRITNVSPEKNGKT